MLRVIRRILRILLLIGLALLAGFVIAVSLGIRVDLEPLRRPFEALATTATGREVRLEGDVFLVPTWSVTVEAHGLRIANPPGWADEAFAQLDLARMRVELLPLLWRRVVIRELRAEGVEADFTRRKDGATNWDFGPGGEAPPEQEAPAVVEPEAEEDAPFWHVLLPTSLTLEELALRDVRIGLRDEMEAIERNFLLDELSGAAATDAPLEFDMRGTYDEDAFEASLRGGDPTVLIGGDKPWPLRVELSIASTRFALAAQLDERDWNLVDALNLFLETARSPFQGLEGQRLGEITITIEGERLDSLDDLLEVSLPHWGPHRFEARFEAYGGGRIQADVTVKVGSSELVGKLALQSRQEPPGVELTLKAPMVQLDDFPLHGWSAFEAPPPEEAPPTDAPPPADHRPLLNPEVMRSLDAKLDIRVARVRSGRDRLGKGRLSATLQGGRFGLERLDIDVPSGSLRAQASLTPRRRSVSGTLSLLIDHFDYGILARRVAPETDMHGIFAMEVDLSSTAPTAVDLIDHASGHFDFAVFPEKLPSGVIDLWAVNLISAVLPALDAAEQSKVNCLVALMDMKDGIMTEHALMVDTSRMTVHGDARIDFPKQRIALEFAPTPKKPQFFSASTPISVDGSFEDFGIGVSPEAVIGTIIRLVASVAYVPILRIFTPPQNPEELDTCLDAIERR